MNLTIDYGRFPLAEKNVELTRQSMVKSYKENYPKATWGGDDVVEVNGKKVGYIEYLSAPDKNQNQTYNFTMFTSVKDNLFTVSLMCTADKGQCKPKAQDILKSLAVKE